MYSNRQLELEEKNVDIQAKNYRLMGQLFLQNIDKFAKYHRNTLDEMEVQAKAKLKKEDEDYLQ
jgi:hypothetical protein